MAEEIILKRKLKACPFCGKKDAKVVKYSDRIFDVVCPCGCGNPRDSINLGLAVKLWTKRSKPQK